MENGKRMRKYQADLKKQKEEESKIKKSMPYQTSNVKMASKISSKADVTQKAKIAKVVGKVKNSKVVKRK